MGSLEALLGRPAFSPDKPPSRPRGSPPSSTGADGSTDHIFPEETIKPEDIPVPVRGKATGPIEFDPQAMIDRISKTGAGSSSPDFALPDQQTKTVQKALDELAKALPPTIIHRAHRRR